MPLFESVPLFLAALACMVAGSMLLSRSTGPPRRRWKMPERLVGLITALAADAPEISSAVVAMLSGQTDVGVGVVFGSNLFSLAALLGLTAVIARRISVRRAPMLLDGAVGILVAAAACALVLGYAGPRLVLAIVLLVMSPYALSLALRRPWSRKSPAEVFELPQPELTAAQTWARMCGALGLIIAGSVGLVRSATALTAGWLPRSLLGTLVLAALTGIPNLYTAMRLAKRGRGSAVIVETMNSNSLNILVGLAIPAVVFGGGAAKTAGAYLDVAALLGLTTAAVALLAFWKGLRRAHGIGIIAAYLVFVAARTYLS